MKPTLTTRAFLFSFLPVCGVLLAAFVALNALVERRIKDGLRESLEHSDRVLMQANAESARRIGQFAGMVAESTGLKAAVGLLREAPRTQAEAEQMRRTIEAQLSAIHDQVDYGFLAVTDWAGRTIAAVDFHGGRMRTPEPMPTIPGQPSLFEFGGALYELSSTPITIGGDQIGALRLGREFDVRRYEFGGDAALLRDGRIVRATFPQGRWAALEEGLRRSCGADGADCEVQWGGESYLARRAAEASLGEGYQVIELRSLDRAAREFTAGWPRTLFGVGASGVLVALLFTLFTARSVSRPLREFVGQLRVGDPHGFPDRITVGQAVTEVQVLADAFNEVAAVVRQSTEDLRQARDAAECASRAKTDFIANISHELRTPMNGIIGMNDLLLMTELNMDQRDYAETVRSSAQALMSVIGDILDYAQLESGKMTLHPAVFDLQQTIMEVVHLLAAQASAKQIPIARHYPADAPTQFVGDAFRIRQVLTNLVGNAIKFTQRGRIDIRVICEENVRLTVEDTGIGIPADKLGIIFERFTQVEGHMSRRFGGAGLGLTIAKQLVEFMGGRIGVESRVGEGSKFWVELPLAAPSNEVEELGAEVKVR